MDTKNFSPADIVYFAATKDAVNLQAAFDQMVGQKVVDTIQARKIEIASTMFNEPEEVSSDEQEEADESADQDSTEELRAQETEESNEDAEVTS